MRKIDRYIRTNVLWSFFAVALVLLGLDYILTFIEQIKRLNDNYDISDLSTVLLYRLPNKFTEYIPISSLIGTLIGLGALATSSELTIIRAAGVPLWRIGLSAIKPLLVIALLGVVISEYIAPKAEQSANLIESLRKQSSNELALTGGAWLKSNRSFIYISAADTTGTLYNIEIFTQREKSESLESIQHARRAFFQGNGEWLLQNVKTTYFFSDHIESQNLTQKTWKIDFQPQHIFLAAQEIEALSVSQLVSYQSYLKQQGLDTAHYQLEFWTKTLRPIATIALVVVALSSVFGPLRSSTMGGRIFSGIIIGLVFQNGLNLFGRMSLVAELSPLIGILIPISICYAIGLIQLRRLR